MTEFIGRNRNTNDTASCSSVALNASTATKIVDANEDGSYFKIDWEMPIDNIYTGEISAIMGSGTHTVHVIEY